MIERITIKNYKSIRHAELDLAPINILIGANGAGKSNFISFLQMVGRIFDRSLQRFIAEQGGMENLLYRGQKHSSEMSGRVEFHGQQWYQFALDPAQIQGLNTLASFSSEWAHNNDGFSEKPMHSAVGESGLPTEILYDSHKFIIYHFHDTSREAHIKQSCRVDDNRFLRENASNLAAYLYYLQRKHSAAFSRIEAIIRSIAPFFDRFDLAPDRINEQYIQLVWRERDSDMFLNAQNLSDGTLRMIALTTLLAQPDLPATIIIDEPELGLHPAAILTLAALLRQASARSQIIVSTQSVNLVNCFEPEDIIAVDRENKQSTFHRLQREKLQEWLEDYTIGELWDKNVFGGRP
jgi:predicted ATPase